MIAFAIPAFVALLAILIALNPPFYFTAIPSGYVGVESWFGQIQKDFRSGVGFFNPLTTSIRHVKVVQDTDKLVNVPCVSIEGVTINVPSIEIANRIAPESVVETVRRFGFEYDTVLVLNPLGQRMRELCAERTVDEIEITHFKDLDDLLLVEIQRQVDSVKSGITIDWVRVTNVVIPEQIRYKRLELASEKASRMLAEEIAKRVAVEKRTEAFIQKQDNERSLAATKLQAEQILTLAEANSASTIKEAAALHKLYEIPGYADVLKMQALSENTKIYFGSELPGNIWLGGGTQPVFHADSQGKAGV